MNERGFQSHFRVLQLRDTKWKQICSLISVKCKFAILVRRIVHIEVIDEKTAVAWEDIIECSNQITRMFLDILPCYCNSCNSLWDISEMGMHKKRESYYIDVGVSWMNERKNCRFRLPQLPSILWVQVRASLLGHSPQHHIKIFPPVNAAWLTSGGQTSKRRTEADVKLRRFVRVRLFIYPKQVDTFNKFLELLYVNNRDRIFFKAVTT